jgi:DtxR family Mn-dependent transcriptional regulator
MPLPNPLAALILTAVGLGVMIALAWPERGLIWILLRAVRANQRVLTEDALKHLFGCEYQTQHASLHSIAGALHISEHRAARLIEQMEALELVSTVSHGFRLTPQGRTYALRVVRAHRLWESYLAERTGLHPTEWHAQAEHLEHATSPDEARRLARQMGHPRFDPHGDPIPTEGGDIVPARGQPLTAIPPGQLAEIIHVEDEPAEAYAQLVALGLHPGVRVSVLEATPQRVRFEADAEEHVLAPILAAHLSVVPILATPPPVALERLSNLELGAETTVVGFSPSCRGVERRRLLDLGLIRGTRVRAELRSPSGDPTGYRIRGAVIALRRGQAENVLTDRLGVSASPPPPSAPANSPGSGEPTDLGIAP